MSDSTPTRKYNLKSTFQPSTFQSPTFSSPAPFQQAGFQEESGLNATSPYNSTAPSAPVDAQSAVPLAVFGNETTTPDALAFASLYHPPLRPLQYQTYAPTPFRKHMQPLAPHERCPDDLFVPPNIRKELSDRNEATLQVLTASTLPDFVHVYHSLVPLDLGPGTKDEQMFGSTVQHYKAVSHTNGRTYCLMRINDFEPSSENENSLQVINKWKRVNSSAIVSVVEAFTTFAFAPAAQQGQQQHQKQSLVIVYEWWPLSRPLADLADPSMETLWCIAVQLFGALLSIHRRGLSTRGLLTDRFVLLNGADRVRIGSLGALDILHPGVGDLQPQDFRDLGALLQKLLKSTPTQEFSEFIEALSEANIERAHQLLSPYVFKVNDKAHQAVDNLESTLAMELENGRLVRLLAKLECALQYPEDYSPLSTKYPLVLFKEYVFHQKTEQGQPSLNLAHSLAALNKLDAGIEDKVLLTSKDGKTRIVISYMELKQLFSSAFESLKK